MIGDDRCMKQLEFILGSWWRAKSKGVMCIGYLDRSTQPSASSMESHLSMQHDGRHGYLIYIPVELAARIALPAAARGNRRRDVGVVRGRGLLHLSRSYSRIMAYVSLS